MTDDDFISEYQPDLVECSTGAERQAWEVACRRALATGRPVAVVSIGGAGGRVFDLDGDVTDLGLVPLDFD